MIYYLHVHKNKNDSGFRNRKQTKRSEIFKVTREN